MKLTVACCAEGLVIDRRMVQRNVVLRLSWREAECRSKEKGKDGRGPKDWGTHAHAKAQCKVLCALH